ncbi:hypothetical protein NC652_013918 [Populus alba x Populus x berolinensis]|nr:hypothetical protein NC652_013918 [Populus alba x Populus x berolinensis]
MVELWVKTPPMSDNGAGCYGWLLEQKRQKLAKERGGSQWLQCFLSLDHDLGREGGFPGVGRGQLALLLIGGRDVGGDVNDE